MKIKSTNNQISPKIIDTTTEMLVSMEEIKEYLRIEEYSNEQLTKYYEAAINFLENYLGKELQLKTFNITIQHLNYASIRLPHYPINNISKIQYLHYGNWVTLPEHQYSVDGNTVNLNTMDPVFAAQIVITYQSGYCPKTIPSALKQAILEYILFSFNHEAKMPDSIITLSKPFKILKI